MKNIFKIVGLASALTFALLAGHAGAQVANTAPTAPAPTDTSPQGDGNITFQTFYDQLASQGTWIQTDKYGYVFQPTENDPNWRPYTYGHWVDTDQGMAWVSDEPFGWATYHYGRWANLDGYGWVWVPGYTWAPAWVSWRDGDDDVGWAPLPPDSGVGIDYYGDDYYDDWGLGYHIGGDCDLAYDIGPWWYNFCPVIYIGDRDCWRHFHDRRGNFDRINHTRNVTNINYRRDGAGGTGRVTAEGPSVAGLNASARTPIEHAQLVSASRPGNAGLNGDSLAVYAPKVDPAAGKSARPASVAQTLANTSMNRGTDINRPVAVNSRITPAGATAEQIHAATLAQGNVPANARVATANTQVSHPLTHALGAMRTTPTTGATFGAGVRATSSAGIGAARVSTPSVAELDARFTGVSAERPGTVRSGNDSRFSGDAEREQSALPSHSTMVYRSSPSYYPAESYRSSSVYHTSAPLFHSSSPSYYQSESSSRSSFAPTATPNFNSGSVGGYAPAAHVSAGSFSSGERSSYSGGERSSGGGAVSSGGGRASSGGGGGFSGGSGRR